MKNYILLLFVSLLSIVLDAQEKATAINFHGVDVYVMMTPTESFTQVGQTIFEPTKKKMSNTEWLDAVMQQSPVKEFDAIVTRNGNTITYIQYKNHPTEKSGIITNLRSNSVDVYYFSIPTKNYTVISSASMGSLNSFVGFYDIIGELTTRKVKLEYDAIIVGLTDVQYIIYKLE